MALKFQTGGLLLSARKQTGSNSTNALDGISGEPTLKIDYKCLKKYR
jgi:hypothetical protein